MAWFNRRMPAIHLQTQTKAPSLLVVADLGRPDIRTVQDYFAAIQKVWENTMTPGVYRYEGAEVPLSRLTHHSLAVERLTLASPLETIVTAAASQYAPLAYAMAGIVVLERAVRLIMAWQKHRQELEVGSRNERFAHIMVTDKDIDEVLIGLDLVPKDHQALRNGIKSLGQFKIVAVERDPE
jgi:hypothetical protein